LACGIGAGCQLTALGGKLFLCIQLGAIDLQFVAPTRAAYLGLSGASLAEFCGDLTAFCDLR